MTCPSTWRNLLDFRGSRIQVVVIFTAAVTAGQGTGVDGSVDLWSGATRPRGASAGIAEGAVVAAASTVKHKRQQSVAERVRVRDGEFEAKRERE